MSAAPTAHELTELAKSRAPADRERLMLAIVDLCSQADQAVRAPAVQALLGSIFLNLVSGAEQDIRRLLAEKLAAADWPPTDLINVLALDEIEIARPIIALSPVLKDADLVQLLVQSTIEHQIEVARRPSLGPPVVQAILSQAEPAVLTALASNGSAELSPAAMLELVEASRQIAGMRSPLVRHPRLTTEMAQRLYAWVGQSLRSAIVTRFRVDVDALDKALAEAVNEAHALSSHESTDQTGPFSREQEEMERRLIAKLHAAGQLRPSYLLRALKEGKLTLFQATLATLGGYSPEEVGRAVGAGRPDLLAMACLGVGVDRGAFPSVLTGVRELNGGRPGGDVDIARRTFDSFRPDQTVEAAAAFRKSVAGV